METKNFLKNVENISKDYFLNLGLEESSIENLIKLGKESLKKHLEDLEKKLEEGKIKSSREILHSIIGILLNMGDNIHVESFKEIQSLVKEEKLKEAIDKLKDLIEKK